MINPTINVIVMIVFGFLAGALLKSINLIAANKAWMTAPRRPARWRDLFREEARVEQREFNQKLMAEAGRPFWALLAAFYGLIAVIVLSLWLSPLDMQWLVFVGAVLGGFMIVGWIFSLAKAGKLGGKDRSVTKEDSST